MADAKPLSNNDNCITITFGDVAENGPGMEKIGVEQKCKFKCKYLCDLATRIEGAEIIDLVEKSKVQDMFTKINPKKACVLVIRDFHTAMSKLRCGSRNKVVPAEVPTGTELFQELRPLKWDTKCLMRGEVKNKIARHNLCFADFTQKPEYTKGKGRVYNFEDLPNLNKMRECIRSLVDMKALIAEGNLYYDVTKCGIGYHGDTERNVTIGLRLGAPINLYFHWYHKAKVVSKRVRIKLGHGDLYIMSVEAVGKEWRCSSKLTLRHAAGCKKYTS